MMRQQISTITLGVGLGLIVWALIMTALSVPGPASAAPPAQPSERPTIDIDATHDAQTAQAPPPTSPPGGDGGGGGPQPTETAPGTLVLPSATWTPTARAPRPTRTPSLTPTQTPDVSATNQAAVQSAVQATLTALPPEATAFITVTVLAPTSIPPTLAPTTIPPTAAPISAPATQPAAPAETNQMGVALWLVVMAPLILLLIVLFWLLGYRFLLPFVGLGRPRPRQGDVKAGRQYARRKRLPY